MRAHPDVQLHLLQLGIVLPADALVHVGALVHGPPVYVQVVRTGRAGSAQVALIGPLSRVRLQVPHQLGTEPKEFATYWAVMLRRRRRCRA